MKDFKKRIEKYLSQLESLLNSTPHFFSSVQRKEISNKKGIYAIFEHNSDLLYIGISQNLRRRLFSEHVGGDKIGSAFRKSLSKFYNLGSEKKITEYIIKNCSFKYMELENPNHLEHFLISVLKPRLNK